MSGALDQSSRIRPNRLFTADAGIIVYRAGHVSDAKLKEVVDQPIAILRAGPLSNKGPSTTLY